MSRGECGHLPGSQCKRSVPDMNEDITRESAGRRILIAGATGLVGSQLLRILLADHGVGAVCTLGRRRPASEDARLVALEVDFSRLPALPAVDEVYLALGTTIRQAGSQAAFRAVDLEANLAVAKAVLAVCNCRIGLVSAMGADAQSRVFYNRIKGELEDALAALRPDALVIARPSLLLGDRHSLGQPVRPAEALSQHLGRFLRPLIPGNYRPIEAARVASALAVTVPQAQGRVVMLSGRMQFA